MFDNMHSAACFTLKSHQKCAQNFYKKVSPFYLYQTLCPVTVIVWKNFVDLGQIITEKVVSRLKVFVHATWPFLSHCEMRQFNNIFEEPSATFLKRILSDFPFFS